MTDADPAAATLSPVRRVFRRGRRLFTIASLALIVTAGLHSVGHFAPIPPNTSLQMITEEMAAVRLPLGMGMAPSMLGIFLALSLTMGVTLLWLALQNLAAAAGEDSRVVRRQTWISVLCCGVLVWVYWHYRIPPPFVSLATVEVLFVGALALPG